MANTNYAFRVSCPGKSPVVSGNKRLTVRSICQLLMGLVTGTRAGSGNCSLVAESSSVAATGTLTLSSASGAVGGTINGTLVTVVAAGGDTASAAALATAINAAAAIVSGHVTATSSLGVVTLTSKFPGVAGNAVTLVASGTGVTASGARLTGGSASSSTFSF